MVKPVDQKMLSTLQQTLKNRGAGRVLVAGPGQLKNLRGVESLKSLPNLHRELTNFASNKLEVKITDILCDSEGRVPILTADPPFIERVNNSNGNLEALGHTVVLEMEDENSGKLYLLKNEMNLKKMIESMETSDTPTNQPPNIIFNIVFRDKNDECAIKSPDGQLEVLIVPIMEAIFIKKGQSVSDQRLGLDDFLYCKTVSPHITSDNKHLVVIKREYNGRCWAEIFSIELVEKIGKIKFNDMNDPTHFTLSPDGEYLAVKISDPDPRWKPKLPIIEWEICSVATGEYKAGLEKITRDIVIADPLTDKEHLFITNFATWIRINEMT